MVLKKERTLLTASYPVEVFNSTWMVLIKVFPNSLDFKDFKKEMSWLVAWTWEIAINPMKNNAMYCLIVLMCEFLL